MDSHSKNALAVLSSDEIAINDQSDEQKRFRDDTWTDLQKSENQSIYQNDDQSLRYEFHSKIPETPSTSSRREQSPAVDKVLTVNALNFRPSAAIDHSFGTNYGRNNIDNSIDRIPITNGTLRTKTKPDGSTFFGDIIPFGTPLISPFADNA